MRASAALLDRFLLPFEEALNEKSARSLADARADTAAQARLDELAEKNREGTITQEEKSDYEAMVNAAGMISILQAKARRYLRQQGLA